jgi:uncharacterized membrane protein (UPF0127 family)
MRLRRLFLAFIFFIGLVASAQAACAPDKIDLRGAWGQATYTIELADTPEERARGLMFRESLPRRTGMLFLYDRPQSVSFWMRNTLIPLDMVFIDETGVVRHVHENAIPGDETPIPGGPDILAVLEIKGGQAAQLGLRPGTEVRHPALGAAAVWACPGSSAGLGLSNSKQGQ